MLADRLKVAILLIPLGAVIIGLGGWPFALFVTAVMGAAAWEFAQLYRQGGYAPPAALMAAGAALLTLARHIFGFEHAPLLISLLATISLTVSTMAYQKGRDSAAVDFTISLAGMLYLGWLGGYFISLRNLPDGLWWFMLALPVIALADTGAFSVGRRIGRHKMCPRVSPNKSWEGYIAGVLTGALGGAALAALWGLRAASMSPLDGLIMGGVISALAPLGDLGESMIKRPFGAKDSSRLLPGHGGILDRIDSWIWAGLIGYYLTLWLR